MKPSLTAERYLALDLGAESGRAIVGTFDGSHLRLEEMHRFENRPVRLLTGLHWDILALLAALGDGIAAAERGGPLISLGVDAWGVDFGLLDEGGELLANPLHYRDARFSGMLDQAFAVVPREEIFEQTGIQFLPFNSLYQLLAMVKAGSPLLEAASTFLMIPDLLAYWLTGERAAEFTIATTTQCFDPRAGDWADGLLARLGIPRRLFPEVRAPGTVLGVLRRPETPNAVGDLSSPRVVLPASHDTASAVAALPLRGSDAAYISSGTWSLVGVEVQAPVINAEILALNLTNEGGVEGSFRLLRNVMGLWLLQGIRHSLGWANAPETHHRLMAAADSSPPFRAWIDPDAADFLRPDDMAGAIRRYCRATGQWVPDDVGSLVRTALESLAMRFRWVIDQLEAVTGRAIRTIHVVGGGARNRLLCQMTADATGRMVVAGPVEATALGNILVQAIASGALGSIREGRDLLARSFPAQEFQPTGHRLWDEAYGRFVSVVLESEPDLPDVGRLGLRGC